MRDNARESDDVLRGSVRIFGAEVTVDRLFRVHTESVGVVRYICVYIMHHSHQDHDFCHGDLW